MTRDQYKRAKEIEAELRQVQERIKDIERILDRGVAHVGGCMVERRQDDTDRH